MSSMEEDSITIPASPPYIFLIQCAADGKLTTSHYGIDPAGIVVLLKKLIKDYERYVETPTSPLKYDNGHLS